MMEEIMVVAREKEVGRAEQRSNRQRIEGLAKLAEHQKLACTVSAERARLKEERESLRNDVSTAQLASRELARIRLVLETEKARLEEETKTIARTAQDLEAQQKALEARQQEQDEYLEVEFKERFHRATEKEKELRELEKALESRSRDLDQRDKVSPEKAADVAAREADLATRQRGLERIEREQPAMEEIRTRRDTAICESRPPEAPVDDLATAHLKPSPHRPPPPATARLEELEEVTLNVAVAPAPGFQPGFQEVVTVELSAPEPNKPVLPPLQDHSHGLDGLRSQTNLDGRDEQEEAEPGTRAPSAAVLPPGGQPQENTGTPLDALGNGSTGRVSANELKVFALKTKIDGSHRRAVEPDEFEVDIDYGGSAAEYASTRVTKLSLGMRLFLLREALRYRFTQAKEQALRKLAGWLPKRRVSTQGLLLVGDFVLIVVLAIASTVAVVHLRSLPATPLESPPSGVSANNETLNPASLQIPSPGAPEPSGEAQQTHPAPQGGRTETDLGDAADLGSTGPAKSAEQDRLPPRYKTRRARLKAKRHAAKLRRERAATLSDDEITGVMHAGPP